MGWYRHKCRDFVCLGCGQPSTRESKAPRFHLCRRCAERHAAEGLRAAVRVRRAVLAGELPRADECVCVDCAARARMYDHRDYSRPLIVDSVCASCNQRRGPAVSSFNKAQA